MRDLTDEPTRAQELGAALASMREANERACTARAFPAAMPAPARPGHGGIPPAFVPTPTARRIYETLTVAQEVGDLAVVRAAAGLGKTTALQEFERRNVEAEMFTISDLTRGRDDVLAMLRSRFQIQAAQPALVQEALVNRLAYIGRRAILLLDEAQHLSREAASLLRSIADLTDCAVVFAGNRDVLRNVTGNGRAPLGQAEVWTGEIEQIKSRASAWLELDRLDPDDVAAFLEACGIGTDQPDVTRYCAMWAYKPGGLRNVRNLLREAARLQPADPFTLDALKDAAQNLHLDTPDRFQ